MKHLFLILLLSMATTDTVFAQQSDTIYRVVLPTYNLHDTRLWANDVDRYHYNQMRYYVTTVLPYVQEATRLFNNLNRQLPELHGRERRHFVREQEALVRQRFEDKIVSLNETQGVLLIKLVARQTGLNIYSQLADFKGDFTAMKWQAWARLHGFNLNRRYHPEDEPDLERIMRGLGYPLPATYAAADTNH